MRKVKYKGDIDQFLLEIAKWNVKAKVTGVAFRQIIKDQIAEEDVRRMTMIDPNTDDREWVEAIRMAVKKEEDFKERRKLKNTDSTRLASSSKRK